MSDSITFKQSHSEFIEAFRRKIEENRFEFESRGIPLDNEDLGFFITALSEHIVAAIKRGEDEPFLKAFWNENLGIIGDIVQSSPMYVAGHPFRQTLFYRDREISRIAYGPEVYDRGVYQSMAAATNTFADNFLLPAHVAAGYLSDDSKSRDTLLYWVDFQNSRNWTIIWAKTDWIRLSFPKCYEKMMQDGEFLSVEELEEKMAGCSDQ